jgi:hypothetical protein
MLTFETAILGAFPPIMNRTTPTKTTRAKIAIAAIAAFFLFHIDSVFTILINSLAIMIFVIRFQGAGW